MERSDRISEVPDMEHRQNLLVRVALADTPTAKQGQILSIGGTLADELRNRIELYLFTQGPQEVMYDERCLVKEADAAFMVTDDGKGPYTPMRELLYKTEE